MHPEALREAKFAAGLNPDSVAQIKPVEKIAHHVCNPVDHLSEPEIATAVERGNGKKHNTDKKAKVVRE